MNLTILKFLTLTVFLMTLRVHSTKQEDKTKSGNTFEKSHEKNQGENNKFPHKNPENFIFVVAFLSFFTFHYATMLMHTSYSFSNPYK